MTISRLFLCMVWLGASQPGHAADNPVVPLDAPVERVRIAQQRAQFEAMFDQKQRECYQRFAVSDCLRQARRERRVVFDELRRQEVRLNDLDRQAAAADELSRIQANFSPDRQKELELQRQQALQESIERQSRSDEKKTTTVQPTAASAARPAPPAPGRDDALIQQQRYSDKLREAQQRKADKAKRLKEEEGKAKPLPIPPGY